MMHSYNLVNCIDLAITAADQLVFILIFTIFISSYPKLGQALPTLKDNCTNMTRKITN